MLVAGDREAADGTVSVRERSGGDRGSSTIDAFIAAAREEISSKGKSTHSAEPQLSVETER
jgi:threonyl-tRNA synthetase